jgi:bud site selection protein 31
LVRNDLIDKKACDIFIVFFPAQWKKQGYENLCCLRCIQPRDTNFNKKCICRVPKEKLEEGKVVECVHCGCRGCSG